jgi:hypothetical protein
VGAISEFITCETVRYTNEERAVRYWFLGYRITNRYLKLRFYSNYVKFSTPGFRDLVNPLKRRSSVAGFRDLVNPLKRRLLLQLRGVAGTGY